MSWDSRMHELFGIKPESFSGKYDDFLALVHLEDREKLAQEVTAALNQRTEFAVKFRVPCQLIICWALIGIDYPLVSRFVTRWDDNHSKTAFIPPHPGNQPHHVAGGLQLEYRAKLKIQSSCHQLHSLIKQIADFCARQASLS
jgi:hypothetical protein